MVQRLSLQPVRVHSRALKVFLTSHCEWAPWLHQMTGLVRARKWSEVVALAKRLDESLIDSSYLEWVSDAVSDVTVFANTTQLIAMITKYPYTSDEIPGLDPDRAALDDLLRSERRNARLNVIYRGARMRNYQTKNNRFWWLHDAQEYFLRLFGEEPPIGEILDQCDYSGGASVGVGGKATHFGNKVMTLPISTTPTALKYAVNAIWRNEQLRDHYLRMANKGPHGTAIMCHSYEDLYEWLHEHTVYTSHNKISCVPKKFDMSRTIASEPTANSFVQKGADIWMRKRLRRHGLDLSDQEWNQFLAFSGYCTLDSKGASNSVIIGLVQAIATPGWFSFLNELRSPSGLWPDGVVRRYELFCSMGNGFCFPLETAIFASLCYAACKYCGTPNDFRVYGDDIVCRPEIACVLMEIMRNAGFRLNTSKSFVFGPFRESCGANWYKGQDVTPAYWRKRITTRPELHAIHNAHRQDSVRSCLREFDTSLPFCVPDEKAFSWVTDQAFRVPHDVCMSSSAVWNRDTQSWRYQMLIPSAVLDLTEHGRSDAWESVRRIAALRGSTFDGAFPLRRSVLYRVVRPKANDLSATDRLHALACSIGPYPTKDSWGRTFEKARDRIDAQRRVGKLLPVGPRLR